MVHLKGSYLTSEQVFDNCEAWLVANREAAGLLSDATATNRTDIRGQDYKPQWVKADTHSGSGMVGKKQGARVQCSDHDFFDVTKVNTTLIMDKIVPNRNLFVKTHALVDETGQLICPYTSQTSL